MSLLDDVSIVVTPNGYKAGELYAVIPVPTEGSELVTNGDFATDSDWTKGANTTISSGTLNFSSASSNTDQSLTTTNSKIYKVIFIISNYVSGSVRFRFTGAANVNGTSRSANGTFTQYITATANNSIFRFAASSFTGSIDNVSVKEYTSADMDVTRATAATRVDENGLVNYAEVLGGEEVTNGDFSNGTTDWTVSSGTISVDNGRLKIDSVSGTTAEQTVTAIIGKTYKVTYDFTLGTATSGAVIITGGNYPTLDAPEGTNTFYSVATSTSFRVRPRLGATGTMFVDNVSVKQVDRDNVPRIDYTGGGCPHILAEPQRTNQITQNNQFDTTWVTSNLGLTSGQNGIYNTTDAWLFNATNSLANVTISVSTSGENTYSVYAKAGTEDGIFIRFSGGSNPRAFFNLTNGTLISESGTTNTNVENIGNGWYRCSITGSETITDARIYVANSSGNFASSGNIYVQYSQLENGSYPTSIIPTSGSAVTRNQDQFSRDGIGSLINDSEGVLFVEMAALVEVDANRRFITLNDGGASNNVVLRYEATGVITARYQVGGVAQCSIAFATTIANSHKIAFKYKENDFALWVDGTEVGTDTSGSVLSADTINKLSFDSGNGTFPFFGKVKQLQVFKTALTDTQLAALTS